MPVNTLLSLALSCALLAQESAPATRPDAPLSRADMEADLAFLDAAIREKWSYLEDKQKHFGVDLGALMANAMKQLPENGTKAGFHAIVLELVAGLKDGHASVFTLGVSQPERIWPIRLEEAVDGFVVAEEKKFFAPGLGDRVVAIEGMPIAARLAELERTTIASTDGARRKHALQRLHWTDAGTVSLRFVERDAPEVVREAPLATIPPPEPPKYHDCGPMSALAWTPLKVAPGIACFCVRTFVVEDWANWLKAAPESREPFLTKTKESIDRCFGDLAKLSEADRKALILDLRGNGGGTDLLGIHLAKHLLPKKFVYTRLSMKMDGKWTKPGGLEWEPFPSAQRFDGPLAILIDEDCFSTADNFLRAVVENRDDVITVGRPTNGGTGAPATIAKLPRSGTSVTLCTMRVYGPNGTLIEGRGTTPAVPVRWTAEDFLKKRDPDLAAAIEALRKAESRPK